METNPLLSPSSPPSQQQTDNATNELQNYNSAEGNESSLLGSKSTSTTAGRGKLRFDKRQQMKLKQHQQQRQQLSTTSSSPTSVFGTVFSSKRTISRKANATNSNRNIDNITTATTSKATTKPTKYSKLYTILNPKSHTTQARLFQTTISTIIILDAIIYVFSTEPQLQHLSHFFYIIEGITSTLFLCELIARLVVCTEKTCYGQYGPVGGRWRYICSFQGVIDSLATLPFFIEWITGIALPTLTYLRVFRLIRITRTRSYSKLKAIEALWRVLYFNREILHVAGVLGLYLVVVTSVLMYYLRPRGEDLDGVDDASDFESIGSTMVLSMMMLTGQGGPSGSKLPWYTQLVVLLTGVFSVAMFAIPASMLTWGFEAEAQRLGMKAKRKELAKRKGEVYSSDSSSSSSDDDDDDISTSDEEYINIIGGDEGNEDNELSQGMEESSGWSKADATIDILQLMQARIEQLETKVTDTNAKLDLILAKLD